MEWFSLIIGISVFFFVVLVMPRYILYAKRRGLIGKDMNKYNKPEVAEAGGVVVFIGFFIGLIALLVYYFLMNNENYLLIAAVTISTSIVSMIAYIDDTGGWKKGIARWKKPLFTFIATIPLIPLVTDRTDIVLLGYPLQLPWLFYPLVLVPIGFIGATNAVNLLAGFNGLEVSLAIVSTLALMYFTQGTPFFSVLLIFLFTLMGFFVYNRYPSRVFPGDTLTYLTGSVFAVVAVLGRFQTITILIMMPYLLEGLIKSKEIPYIIKHRKTFKPECFGKVTKDGDLLPPYKSIWSLTHVAIHTIRKIKNKCSENDVVFLLVCMHILWCLFLVAIFG